MQGLQFAISPRKRRDLVGDLEQSTRKIVTRRLVVLKRGRGSFENRARQQFRIAQRVGNAVRGAWIFEVAGVSNERPPRSGTALDETDMPAKSTNRLYPARRVEARFESRRDLTNQPSVGRSRIALNLPAEASPRHCRKQTGGTVVGRNGADGPSGLEPPVIAVDRQVFPIAVEHSRRVPALDRRGRANALRDRRVESVRADDDVGVDAAARAVQ